MFEFLPTVPCPIACHQKKSVPIDLTPTLVAKHIKGPITSSAASSKHQKSSIGSQEKIHYQFLYNQSCSLVVKRKKIPSQTNKTKQKQTKNNKSKQQQTKTVRIERWLEHSPKWSEIFWQVHLPALRFLCRVLVQERQSSSAIACNKLKSN